MNCSRWLVVAFPSVGKSLVTLSVDALPKVEERPNEGDESCHENVLEVEVVLQEKGFRQDFRYMDLLVIWNVLELQERQLAVAMAIFPEVASKCRTSQDSVCQKKTLTLKDPAKVENPLSRRIRHLTELEVQDVRVDQEAQVDLEAERAREGHAKRPSS